MPIPSTGGGILLPCWDAPHFLFGFPRAAPRKESDCDRSQQGDWKRDSLSSSEDGSPCDGDSKVRRSSKEGKCSVPKNTYILTCILIYTYVYTHANTQRLAHLYTDAYTHINTHTHRLTHPNTHNNTNFSVHSHAHI